MAAKLCPLATKLGTSYNVVLVGSRKDWEKYLQKRLGKVTSMPPSSVVIKEIIESPVDSGSLDLGKGQAPSTIKGFTPLVLALLVVARLISSSIQEGTAIVPAIRGFDPLILPKLALGISRVSSLKALDSFRPLKQLIKPS